MALSNHDAFCMCADCRSKRAFGAAVVNPVKPGEPRLPTLDEIPETVRQAVLTDPARAVLAWMENGTSKAEMTHTLSLLDIEGEEADAVFRRAGELYESTRRKRGFRRILLGIVVILGGLLVSEVLLWLTDNYSRYIFISAVFVLVGLYYVFRGIYDVRTGRKRKATESP